MTDTPTPSPSLLQTTLQEVRARIDGEVLKSVKVAMMVSALGGILLMLALSVMPNQNPVMQESRLSSAFALTAIAAVALLLSRLCGPRVSVMFLQAACSHCVWAWPCTWARAWDRPAPWCPPP